MGFDNRAADREAHAHAVGLRRVEWFKETRQALRASDVLPYELFSRASPLRYSSDDELSAHLRTDRAASRKRRSRVTRLSACIPSEIGQRHARICPRIGLEARAARAIRRWLQIEPARRQAS